MTLTFGVQLYKNNAHVLLSPILSILNLDWLQHVHSVCGVYESSFLHENDTNKLHTAQSPQPKLKLFATQTINMSIYTFRFFWLATYRLITAYLLLRVNLDKIMHARWDFDASSARTRRVSALDKHQNWSASALFCLNSRAQSKYAVVNLIHTRRKQTFLSFIMR